MIIIHTCFLSLLRKFHKLETSSNLERRFQSVFESAIDGIIIIDSSGVILDLNQAACRMFQYDKEQLIGSTINSLMPRPHSVKHDSYINNYLTTGIAKIIGIGREVEGLRKDGTLFPFWLSVNEVKLDDGSIFTGFIHDLTDIRKAEKELVNLNMELEKKVVQRTYDLEKVVNQLLQLNKKLEDEISARKFTEEQLKIRESELKQSLAKEKELGELKSRFVSMASHEFRTPLATIASSASLVTKYTDESTQANRQRHIEKIKSSVTHLTNILNDFLSITKLEEGKVQAKIIQCDLEELLTDFADEIKPLFENNKMFFTSVDLHERIINSDPNILRNILFNLISNAIKYTKNNGVIELKVKDDRHDLYIQIKDNGIGIPEHEQKHLFDRFFRAGNASNIEGTGLGLFIVKKYIEMLKGEIEFESIEGSGTTFNVILPKINQ